MKLAGYYFKLQMKKCIRVIPIFFVSIILMTLLSVIGILFAGRIAGDANSFEKVKVAVVILDENKSSKQIMSFVQSMENVNAVCDFIYLTEKEAEQALQNGIADAEILISPYYYENVNTEINSPVTVYMTEKQFEHSVFKELLSDGVQFISVASAAIYGTSYTMRQFGMRNTVSDMETHFTDIYVVNILKRGETFQQIILSLAGEQKISRYYLTVVVLMIAVMLGLCFGFLYCKEEFQIMNLLWARGLTPVVVSVCKTMTMALQIGFFLMVCYGAVWLYSVISQSGFLYADWFFMGRILLVAISIATYFHMIYACLSKSSSGGLVIFILNIVMCLFSGILVPFSGIPKAIVLVHRFVPFTIWQQCMDAAFFGEGSFLLILKLLLITVVFEMIGVFCLCRKV